MSQVAEATGPLVFAPMRPKDLSPEEVGRLLSLFPAVEEYIKLIRTYAFAELETGTRIPGWKLVAKNPTIKWANPDDAEKWLCQYVDTRELFPRIVTPLQAEKLLKYTGLKLPEDLVVETPRTDLAPEGDPRPAVHRG